MEWTSGLNITGVAIEEISDYEQEAFQQHMEALYELTYKYDQIDLHEYEPAEGKQALLSVADAGIRDMARTLSSMLLEVFDDWLEKHAITDPHKWAEMQWTEEEVASLGDSKETWVAMAASSYNFQKWHADHPSHKGRFTAPVYPMTGRGPFQLAFDKAIPKMKNLARILQPLIDEYDTTLMDEHETGEIYEKPEPMSVEDYLDIQDLSDLMSLLEEYDAVDIMVDIYEHVLFPVWFARWKAQGIVSTRRRIVRAREKLYDINVNTMVSYAIPQLSKDLNIIIATAHQTGSMTDYIDSRYDCDGGAAKLLESLSMGPDTNIMDEELEEMGVQRAVDRSAARRRQDRETARKFVAEAWKTLAKRQKNPRMTLQQAVLKRLGHSTRN